MTVTLGDRFPHHLKHILHFDLIALSGTTHLFSKINEQILLVYISCAFLNSRLHKTLTTTSDIELIQMQHLFKLSPSSPGGRNGFYL